jgi:hypothetical protein
MPTATGGWHGRRRHQQQRRCPRSRARHPPHTVGALQDEIKQLKRRLEEQRAEIDELRDLNRRLVEHLEDADRITEAWCETFDMEMTDGGWTWKPFWDAHNALIDDYNALVRKWNKAVPLLNNKSRPVGRPLAANETQVD